MKYPQHAAADRPIWPDDRELDDLVDGSLTEDQRTVLLLKLDEAPQGWKRCALAFLEAQTFRDALTPFGRAGASMANAALPPALAARPGESSSQSPSFAVVPAEPAASRRQRKAKTPLFAAACAALAFWAGWALKPDSTGGSQFVEQPSARAVKPLGTDPEPTQGAQVLAKVPGEATEMAKENGVGTNQAEVTQPVMALAQTEGMAAAKELSLRSMEEAIRQLEKKGYRADLQEQLVSVKTPDGRWVEVPVREWTLKYRGKQTY